MCYGIRKTKVWCIERTLTDFILTPIHVGTFQHTSAFLFRQEDGQRLLNILKTQG